MPKIALISDVHSNLPALERVIEELEKESPDLWVCLGDIVGYGPFPSECIDLVRQKKMQCVYGNHDAGVVGTLSLKHFRNPNQKLIELTKSLISKDQLDWLESLPLIIESDNNWMAAHASPINPENWVYIDSAFKGREVLGKIEYDICFVGHTHKPSVVSNRIGLNRFVKGGKYLINPGSVGQSRDEDYRASCAIIDTDNWKYKNFRVEYDTEQVLTALMKLGFNRKECNRLLKI